MSAYNTAVSILKNNVGIEIPPEIYNNMAALHFWQGNLDEAKVTVVTELSQARRPEMKWGCFFCKKSGQWDVFCKKQKMGFL